jgi:hypothetical protein
VTLSKEQRDKLRAAGFNAKDVEDVEASLVEPEPEGPGRRSKGPRLLVMEGETASSFIERWFGSDETETPDEETTDDEPDTDVEETDDEETDEESTDDKPGSSVGYFRDRAKRSTG